MIRLMTWNLRVRLRQIHEALEKYSSGKKSTFDADVLVRRIAIIFDNDCINIKTFVYNINMRFNF